MDQRISLVTLGVTDLQRSKNFYASLGWSGHEVSETVFFPCGGMAVVLWSRMKLVDDAGITDTGADFGGIMLAHNVRSATEVDALLSQAESAGAQISQPARETFYGGYAGTFLDPDGHAWEVAFNPHFPLDDQGNLTIPQLT